LRPGNSTGLAATGIIQASSTHLMDAPSAEG
jgi:hypothetical protein